MSEDDLKQEVTEEQGNEVSTKKKKKIIVVGCLSLAVLAVGGISIANMKDDEKQVVAAEQQTSKPVITLYGSKLVAGVNADVNVQEKLIKSIKSQDAIKEVSIELLDTSKKSDMVVADVKGEVGKLGVPAKTIKFNKEGSYTVVIKAETYEGGKAEAKVYVEVGSELVGYVKGLKDWTVEIDSTNVDFMKDVTWDKEKITAVTVDSTKVDLKKAGTYDLTYTIKGKVNNEEKSVIKKVSVKVLNKTEAAKEAEKGNVVTITDNEIKKDSKGATPTGEVSNGGGTQSASNSNNTNSNGGNSNVSNSNSNSGGGESPQAQEPSQEPSNPAPQPQPEPAPEYKPEPEPESKPESKPQPEEPKHEHSWSNVTSQVNHPATGHNEQYVIRDAYTTGGEPIYDMVEICICSGCGADITNINMDAHAENHMMNGENGGWYSDWVEKQVGTTPIVNHPAEYGTRYVEDSSAWTETVVTGQSCSCGATK